MTRWAVPIGIGALVVGVGFFVLLGGNPKDQFFEYTVTNDLQVEVAIAECTDSDCHRMRDASMSQPFKESTLIISDRGVIGWWVVINDASEKLGCLRFEFRGQPEHPSGSLSELMVACPRSFRRGSTAKRP